MPFRKVKRPSRTPSEPNVDREAPDARVSFLFEDPIVQVLMTVSAAFQRVETGRSWLFTPNQSLGNVPPIAMISTEVGREKVVNELGLVEHGMF
jgi:antitoxin Xre/MbcA/ParS-like protein